MIFDEFKPNASWKTYKNRFQFCFTVKSIKDNENVLCFYVLTMLNFSEIIKVFDELCDIKVNERERKRKRVRGRERKREGEMCPSTRNILPRKSWRSSRNGYIINSFLSQMNIIR